MSDWLPENVWDVAADETLPPGVIEFRHPDGRRDRFPLIEFMVGEPILPWQQAVLDAALERTEDGAFRHRKIELRRPYRRADPFA